MFDRALSAKFINIQVFTAPWVRNWLNIVFDGWWSVRESTWILRIHATFCEIHAKFSLNPCGFCIELLIIHVDFQIPVDNVQNPCGFNGVDFFKINPRGFYKSIFLKKKKIHENFIIIHVDLTKSMWSQNMKKNPEPTPFKRKSTYFYKNVDLLN